MKALLLCLALLFSAPSVGAVDAQAHGLTPGVHFQILPLPPQTGNNKPEIVYFFWVGCKHCQKLEAALPTWLAQHGDAVSFRRVPAVFRPVWRLHALGYYAAISLNQGDYFMRAMTKAILEQGHELKSREELIAFAVAEGLNREAFIEALDSPTIKRQVLAAERLQKKFLLAGVPAMIIDSHYVSNGKMAGTSSELLRIVAILSGQTPPPSKAMSTANSPDEAPITDPATPAPAPDLEPR